VSSTIEWKDLLSNFDKEMQTWKSRFASASRNISEMGELPEFTGLQNAVRQNKLKGQTLITAKALLSSMEELWAGILMISPILDEADGLRKTATGIFGDKKNMLTAWDLIHAPSIEIPSEKTPVLARTLTGNLSGVAQKVTLEALLNEMDKAFERAKVSLIEVDNAKEAMVTRINNLTELNREIELMSPDESKAIKERISVILSTTGFEDPVGSLLEIDKIDQQSHTIKATLEAEQQERVLISQMLVDANLKLDQLSKLQAEISNKHQIISQKILEADNLKITPSQDAMELSGWLVRLENNAKADKRHAVKVGITTWLLMYGQVLTERQAVLKTLLGLEDKRQDVKGRFSAIDARRLGLKKEGKVNSTVDQYAGILYSGLEKPKTSLAEMMDVLSKLEKELFKLNTKGLNHVS
jgi:hypothetical protein